MTGWNLPPGCTDADIDRAAPGGDDPRQYECDCCGKPSRTLHRILPGPNSNAPCETFACPECCGREEEEEEPEGIKCDICLKVKDSFDIYTRYSPGGTEFNICEACEQEDTGPEYEPD
jgi:hypothetical protein